MREEEYWLRFACEEEKPLEHFVTDGGYCKIFRTVGCVGDSLSSGEFESLDENGVRGYHDMFAYSWGQFLARDCGSRVYNFSRGGMTAKEYMEGFAEENGFWDPEKRCQAYILALGVNDIINGGQPVGEVSDIDLSDWRNNRPTFAGYYGAIVQRLREISPKSRMFFVTIPKTERGSQCAAHTALLYGLTEVFPFSYVIDLDRYGAVHDAAYRSRFYMGGHLNPMGYVYAAKQMESYIDWIIRRSPEDFFQIPFLGSDIYNKDYIY